MFYIKKNYVNVCFILDCDRGWVFYEKCCYFFLISKEFYVNVVVS